MFLHADSEDSVQTGWMPRLIRVIVVRACHFVGFVMWRLILIYSSFIVLSKTVFVIAPARGTLLA